MSWIGWDASWLSSWGDVEATPSPYSDEPHYATINHGKSHIATSDGEGHLTLGCGINYLDLEALN